MLAGRVLVTRTVVGGPELPPGAELAGAELTAAELAGAELAGWTLDCDIGTGVCLSVLRLLAITGLTKEDDGGTTTVVVLVAGTSVDVTFDASTALFASEISLVAMAASSLCTASIAVRSSLNTPCLNFEGE